MVMPDKWIIENAKKGMITPFFQNNIQEGVMSYGVSSYGYDFSLSEEFKIFKGSSPIDPKNIQTNSFVDFKGKICEIQANSFILGRSIESFSIPRNILGICYGKSSYARSGIVVYITPLEPEWQGHLTILIYNVSPVLNKIYANEGIGQVIFLKSDSICEKSYLDKKGKYQNSKGIVLGK
ncbi:MAG: dCTP deaminase [Candidatus Omnitrophica bacterium]|jgi:dCTP deaminase|nr:dCTP deaminase [Candidatus Omnitrophota bacterium]